MKNVESNSVEQMKNDVRNIEIEDLCNYTTGSKTIAKITIRVKEGMKQYRLIRTSKGGYTMQ